MSETNPNQQSARNELRAKLINDLALLVYLSVRREMASPRTGDKAAGVAPKRAADTRDER
jgi:hypothetical protein